MWWMPSPSCEYVLMHHGIKGQKWGVRRWQNDDGSFNQAGKQRYGFLNKAGKALAGAGSAVGVAAGVGAYKAHKFAQKTQKLASIAKSRKDDFHSMASQSLDIAYNRHLSAAEKAKYGFDPNKPSIQWIRQARSYDKESQRYNQIALDMGRRATEALMTKKALQIGVAVAVGTAAVGVGMYAASRIMKKRSEKESKNRK